MIVNKGVAQLCHFISFSFHFIKLISAFINAPRSSNFTCSIMDFCSDVKAWNISGVSKQLARIKTLQDAGEKAALTTASGMTEELGSCLTAWAFQPLIFNGYTCCLEAFIPTHAVLYDKRFCILILIEYRLFIPKAIIKFKGQFLPCTMASINCITPCTALSISYTSLWVWQLQYTARIVVADKFSFWNRSIWHRRMRVSLEDIAKLNALSKIRWTLQALFLPTFEGICSLWSFAESTQMVVLWAHIVHAIQIRGIFLALKMCLDRGNNSGLSKRRKQSSCFIRNVWKPIPLYVFLHYITVCCCGAVRSCSISTENAAALIVSAIFSLTTLRVLWCACILLQIIPGIKIETALAANQSTDQTSPLSKYHKTTFSMGKQWWEILQGVIHVIAPASSYLSFSRVSQQGSISPLLKTPAWKFELGCEPSIQRCLLAMLSLILLRIIAKYFIKKNTYSF